MAKSKRRVVSPAHGAQLATPPAKQLPFVVDKATVDPTLADLFASSLGPVRVPPKSRYQAEIKPSKQAQEGLAYPTIDDEDSDEVDYESNQIDSGSGVDSGLSSDASTPGPILQENLAGKENRKRKRRHQQDEDLEDLYMQRLAMEEAKDEGAREAGRSDKRRRTIMDKANGEQNGSLSAEDDADSMEEAEASGGDEGIESEGSASVQGIPQHETLAAANEEADLEKSSRTVFLGNVSTLAITSKSDKKTLLAHLSSFLSSLPLDSSTSHRIETLRFRSTAFSTVSAPKKAAFVKKELMDATTKSTNAYVVYSTPLAAREAVKRLNGTIVLDRHLRVDGVAHPAKIDHKRCVFVGNLGFVDDDSLINAGEDSKKKKRPPADMEEGLWREFGKAGIVESVRVVRDPKTRVGKGFAYVQFTDPNAVETALLYNEKKFPPMLPRKLRVTRAKHINKTASASNSSKPLFPAASAFKSGNKIYNPKPNSQTRSLHGRASKLLGRAGAAKLRASVREAAKERRGSIGATIKTPEVVVFEGYRALSGAKPTGMRMPGGSRKKQRGKERTRRTARAAAWKANGGKK
ncbi:hypothetical protein FGG08_000836 [Glutinoglossum americanum]|uniref:Nucleolar protein 12 n=1 Tax=Glutinoglossum americanum TaxID=1670608 RepID=A0A9P8IC78_9PEZI|nr:hypothetical protein FGG08_000836 [Glutinoglossum americanum]